MIEAYVLPNWSVYSIISLLESEVSWSPPPECHKSLQLYFMLVKAPLNQGMIKSFPYSAKLSVRESFMYPFTEVGAFGVTSPDQ